MFKGIAFLLALVLIIVFVIFAIGASFLIRTIHRVKSLMNRENADDDYNPEIGKKHQHYTYKARTYGGSTSQPSSVDEGNDYSETQSNEDHIHKSSTGEELYETRDLEKVNRQIFSSEEGEYVDFTEER